MSINRSITRITRTIAVVSLPLLIILADRQQQQQLQLYEKVEGFSSHEVLNGVDLKIKEGEFVTIVGPSGCGKSILLNIIAGLDRPDSGSVLIRGHSPVGYIVNKKNNDISRRRSISMA